MGRKMNDGVKKERDEDIHRKPICKETKFKERDVKPKKSNLYTIVVAVGNRFC